MHVERSSRTHRIDGDENAKPGMHQIEDRLQNANVGFDTDHQNLKTTLSGPGIPEARTAAAAECQLGGHRADFFCEWRHRGTESTWILFGAQQRHTEQVGPIDQSLDVPNQFLMVDHQREQFLLDIDNKQSAVVS